MRLSAPRYKTALAGPLPICPIFEDCDRSGILISSMKFLLDLSVVSFAEV
jgi:hypothetical protein